MPYLSALAEYRRRQRRHRQRTAQKQPAREEPAQKLSTAVIVAMPSPRRHSQITMSTMEDGYPLPEVALGIHDVTVQMNRVQDSVVGSLHAHAMHGHGSSSTYPVIGMP